MPYIVVKEIEINHSPFLMAQSLTIKLEVEDLGSLSNYFTDIWNATEEEIVMYCLENNVEVANIKLLTNILKIQKGSGWVQI